MFFYNTDIQMNITWIKHCFSQFLLGLMKYNCKIDFLTRWQTHQEYLQQSKIKTSEKVSMMVWKIKDRWVIKAW